MKKKLPLLPMIVINRFERSCGTFRGGGGKNPLLSMTLGQFAQNKTKQKTKNNDHGVDVNILIVI
jgi:hypothetical protein